MPDLTTDYFHDEDKAREYLERIRWPDGPVCPHCGSCGKMYPLRGNATRKGLYKCGDCRRQFTVTVGTIFERTRIPLQKWLTAIYLLCSSKKGLSSHQLHRNLGITYKSAWFVTHRIREAMKDPVFTRQLGGQMRAVESDETFWGSERKKSKRARGYAHKMKILSLIERGGEVRSFHVQSVAGPTLKPILKRQIAQDTRLMTDEMGAYRGLGEHFASHDIVTHSKGEYVRGNIHVNTLENYFSILKRGLVGVYQHVGANHLRRYVAEFDFRYNNRHLNDLERANVALQGAEGKRLMYRDSLGQQSIGSNQ